MTSSWTRAARLAVGGALAASLPWAAAAADPAPFDLTGPPLIIAVTRGGQTLPIGNVPSLAKGDKIEIKADLPTDQAARYLLVSAFLRGATNPPPKDWIKSAETWNRKDKKKTLKLTVPDGASQLVLFLVPDTGGDFSTVLEAVRGKPGEFVRATQDLNQASLDRSRLDAFMSAIRTQDNTHPEYLRTVAPTLAGSLAMKLNAECLDRVVQLQASCLLENREALVLSDIHSSSMAETLSGAPADLALQISSTPEAGFGYYSAYIGVVRDIARIFGAFRSPQFDYLPTLAVNRADRMTLLLNSAPSFIKPKSVLVVAMPGIETDVPPRLRSGAQAPVCLSRPDAVLPVAGAPLIYSTSYARNTLLRAAPAKGEPVDLALTARSDRGGYILQNRAQSAPFAAGSGTIMGNWGFGKFEGPRFDVQFSTTDAWALTDPAGALNGGTITLKGPASACIERITLESPTAKPHPIEWKAIGPDELAVTAPSGGFTLKVKQYGQAEEAPIAVVPPPPPPPAPEPTQPTIIVPSLETSAQR